MVGELLLVVLGPEMAKKLITLSEEERRQANRSHHDPWAWKMVEDRANHDVCDEMRRIAWAIETAMKDPDHPDAERLLRALWRLLRALWSIHE